MQFEKIIDGKPTEVVSNKNDILVNADTLLCRERGNTNRGKSPIRLIRKLGTGAIACTSRIIANEYIPTEAPNLKRVGNDLLAFSAGKISLARSNSEPIKSPVEIWEWGIELSKFSHQSPRLDSRGDEIVEILNSLKPSSLIKRKERFKSKTSLTSDLRAMTRDSLKKSSTQNILEFQSRSQSPPNDAGDLLAPRLIALNYPPVRSETFALEPQGTPEQIGKHLCLIMSTLCVATIQLPPNLIIINDWDIRQSVCIIGCPGSQLWVKGGVRILSNSTATASINIRFIECSFTLCLDDDKESQNLFEVQPGASLELQDCQMTTQFSSIKYMTVTIII